MKTLSLVIVVVLTLQSVMQDSFGAELPKLGTVLTDAQVAAFANLALEGMEREYPNKPSNVMVGPDSIKSPKEMHPAFYGCFDWHSSVHGHWMLVRLLKLYPECSTARRMRERLARHLTLEKMKTEAAYFDIRENRSFERMYGWAWALRLATELHTWDDEDGREWRDAFRPLENKIVELMKGYLPRLSHPIRTGVHPDTAFALGQATDYARTVGDDELEKLIIKCGRDYYVGDRNYPAQYEPSGEDFFSAGLNEADFMRRILPKDEFSDWLDRFFPGLREKQVGNLLEPVEVTDVTDGKLVHLAGLDLSRGWTMLGIASALEQDDQRKTILTEAALSHARMGYGYVFSGHYEGEHWLATFAVYLQTGVGLE
ncbi:MAG: DUF2891 domain-containing protein [Planctomycetes bacterium]|nr:DUF2891 domain-containing protein [Planctomycetota bacterium]MBL7037448.1 DUF2891 domain-containing protein [Pirellulaceae bacterium]